MIPMVDLKGQYEKIRPEVNQAIQDVLDSTRFIGGEKVQQFQANLATYLGNGVHVIPCANGTDALQIALMALDLTRGDEVIVPAFTYVATAEVIALLGLTPIMVDVDETTFNVLAEDIEEVITARTKAIVPVHLFGQVCDMEPILALAQKHDLYVIEDNAQAIGADYTFTDGRSLKSGTLGNIGTTSFFPSKNLGCYGDGGAIFTRDASLAERIRQIANHGQGKRYHHDTIGCNSRLDAIQAVVLDVKLKHLDAYSRARQKVATAYDTALKDIEGIDIPRRTPCSTHVFHQYVIKVVDGKRAELMAFLTAKGIASNIYYPIPLYKQKAFESYYDGKELPITESLCKEVLALPIHTEMSQDTIGYITRTIKEFYE